VRQVTLLRREHLVMPPRQVVVERRAAPALFPRSAAAAVAADFEQPHET
jgi:hypothetical protein